MRAAWLGGLASWAAVVGACTGDVSLGGLEDDVVLVDEVLPLETAPGDRIRAVVRTAAPEAAHLALEILGPDGNVVAATEPGSDEMVGVETVRGLLTSGPWEPCESGSWAVHVYGEARGRDAYDLSVDVTSTVRPLEPFRTVHVDTCEGEDHLTASAPVNGIGTCDSAQRTELAFRIAGSWSNAHVSVTAGHLVWIDEVGRGLSAGGSGYAECGAAVACGNNWSNTGNDLVLLVESDAPEGCGPVDVTFDTGVLLP